MTVECDQQTPIETETGFPYYDSIRSTLVITAEQLRELSSMVTGRSDPAAAGIRWSAGGIIEDGRIDPIVAGITEVAGNPMRSILVERFSRGLMVPLFVAWGAGGRCTITDGSPDGHLLIQATTMDLLPSLLMQAVRLHGRSQALDRDTVTCRAADLEAALGGDTAAAPVDPSTDLHHDIQAIFATMSHAWRATGSWTGSPSDSSITVISTGESGLWSVGRCAGTAVADVADAEAETDADADVDTDIDVDAEDPAAAMIELRPTTAKALMAELGDVVSGRHNKQAPRA